MEVAVSMNFHMTECVGALGQYKRIGALAATLLVMGAIAGWGISTTFVRNAAAIESAFDMRSVNDKKAALGGSPKEIDISRVFPNLRAGPYQDNLIIQVVEDPI
jgi:hypothetical protein